MHISSDALSVVVVHDGAMPQIVSIGRPVPGYVPAGSSPSLPKSTLAAAPPLGILTEHSTGFPGRPGIEGARPDGSAWSPRFELRTVDPDGDAAVTFRLADELAALELDVKLRVDDVLTVTARLTNTGDAPYQVLRLAPTIPVPHHFDEVLTFTGRWCREFQPRRTGLDGLLVENRTGRTSHTRLPAAFAGPAGFSEQSGEVIGVQLAWSGNHTLLAETLPDGRRHLQLGELLAQGEVELAPGETYAAPDVVVAWSAAGISAASTAFHRHVRARLPMPRPRPVLLNTWEAVYFDHRLRTLEQLATVAAEVGVERFVLDDGWFGGRRDDTAGLGDWWVSDAAWPTGLGPIVEHVRGLGMEFGLWVEPEMVNPDSDLYRAHPEWTLTTVGYEPILGRNQLVLDLGRPEVCDFLFDAFDGLLREYEIAYLKWDMNRDVVQGSRFGRAGAHGHVAGVYALIDRLRSAHPQLEIESCASGGGRTDLGILRRAERIWTSDCNDALERQLIQRGCSMLFPPEVMGAHIGPERAHTTGRRQDLGFRAATALFGHLGVEWNLLDADPDQLALVASAIALHKRLRPLLHGGDVVRGDHPDPAALVHGVVSPTGEHAVFAYVQLTPSAATAPAPVRFPGLAEDRHYRVVVLEELTSAKEFGHARPEWMDAPFAVPGAQLSTTGLTVPVQHPESVLLFELTALDPDSMREDTRDG